MFVELIVQCGREARQERTQKSAGLFVGRARDGHEADMLRTECAKIQRGACFLIDFD